MIYRIVIVAALALAGCKRADSAPAAAPQNVPREQLAKQANVALFKIVGDKPTEMWSARATMALPSQWPPTSGTPMELSFYAFAIKPDSEQVAAPFARAIANSKTSEWTFTVTASSLQHLGVQGVHPAKPEDIVTDADIAAAEKFVTNVAANGDSKTAPPPNVARAYCIWRRGNKVVTDQLALTPATAAFFAWVGCR